MDPLIGVTLMIAGAMLFPLGLSFAVGLNERRRKRRAFAAHPAE